ncbi:GTPase [Actinocatenispora thailandica]|uniref:GTPase n=1 Tax=Actinocatenispora thailandica TaxID=227318 RepID=UPI0031D37F20
MDSTAAEPPAGGATEPAPPGPAATSDAGPSRQPAPGAEVRPEPAPTGSGAPAGAEPAERYPGPAASQVPPGDLAARLRALTEFVEAADGRVPDERLAPVRALLARADERLALSERHTVVVLAGTTGSGKSRLFNALTGLDLSRVGARRPTTADLHACIWEPAGTGPLLDWLGVPPENRTERESVLDGDAQRALHGLVLIDMPDFDSIEYGHRPMVERLIGSADMVLWVLDPQKYADRTVHEHYLSSLVDRDAAVTVVLNQVDRLPETDVDRLAADLRRLLGEDGLPAVPVHLASARTGLGVAALRSTLADAVAGRQAATVRIAADLAATVDGLADLADAEPPTGVAAGELADRLSARVGVAGLVDAAEQDLRRRGRRATGWLFIRRALGGRNPDRILAQERYDLDWLDDTTPAEPARAKPALAGADPRPGQPGVPQPDAAPPETGRTAAGQTAAARIGTAQAGDLGTRDGRAGDAGAPGEGQHRDERTGYDRPEGSGSGDAPAGEALAAPSPETGATRAGGSGAAGTGGAAKSTGAGTGRQEAGPDPASPVPEARRIDLGGALRTSLGPVFEPLPMPWRDALRGALTEQVPALGGRLAGLPAQAARGTRPAWWTVLGVLQWIFGVAAVLGAGWLIAATVSDAVPDPGLAALWLLAGGVLLGVASSLAALPLVGRAARAERAGLDAALRATVAAAAHDCVQVPVDAELAAYRTAHTALSAARGR